VIRALLRLYARHFHHLPTYTLRSPFKA